MSGPATDLWGLSHQLVATLKHRRLQVPVWDEEDFASSIVHQCQEIKTLDIFSGTDGLQTPVRPRCWSECSVDEGRDGYGRRIVHFLKIIDTLMKPLN